jgi:hypothetical protein
LIDFAISKEKSRDCGLLVDEAERKLQSLESGGGHAQKTS